MKRGDRIRLNTFAIERCNPRNPQRMGTVSWDPKTGTRSPVRWDGTTYDEYIHNSFLEVVE